MQNVPIYASLLQRTYIKGLPEVILSEGPIEISLKVWLSLVYLQIKKDLGNSEEKKL